METGVSREGPVAGGEGSMEAMVTGTWELAILPHLRR